MRLRLWFPGPFAICIPFIISNRLAPRYANDADELVPRGFNRWVKTWIVDYVSVEEVYWNVPGDKIDPAKLPSRAPENAAERDATLAAIADYNESQDMTPELDARFGQLAADRIHAHPIRYYVALPALRVADMWLRPRTELLPPDPRWWEFNDDAKHSAVAVGFGLMNLAYVAAAGLAIFHRGSRRAIWNSLGGIVGRLPVAALCISGKCGKPGTALHPGMLSRHHRAGIGVADGGWEKISGS